jgi:hypothetical protein
MLAPKFSLGGGHAGGEDDSSPTIVGPVPKQGQPLAPHKRAGGIFTRDGCGGNGDLLTDTILLSAKSRYVRSG